MNETLGVAHRCAGKRGFEQVACKLTHHQRAFNTLSPPPPPVLSPYPPQARASSPNTFHTAHCHPVARLLHACTHARTRTPPAPLPRAAYAPRTPARAAPQPCGATHEVDVVSKLSGAVVAALRQLGADGAQVHGTLGWRVGGLVQGGTSVGRNGCRPGNGCQQDVRTQAAVGWVGLGGLAPMVQAGRTGCVR